MISRFFHHSLRARLIVPVAMALVVSIVAAMSFVVVMEGKRNSRFQAMIGAGFEKTGREINKDMEVLSRELQKKLAQMSSSTQEALTVSTEESLSQAAEDLQADLKTLRKQSGQTLALLLAQVAEPAIIAKDYTSLNRYVRSGHKNPAVVFIFYQDRNGRSLTRYLNRKNAKLRSYLPKGRPDIQKIIRSGQEDPNVLVVSQPVLSDGEQIGTVFLALDMTSARQKAEALNERFSDLISANEAQVQAIFSEKSGGILQALQGTIDRIKEETDRTAAKIREEIAAASSAMSARVRNTIVFGSVMCLGLVLAILLINARSILRQLGGEPSVMVGIARRIARGDLSVSLERPGKDDNSLQGALQEMVLSLQQLIGRLMDESKRMSVTSKELTAAAEDMSQNAELSAERSATVASATEEMSSNMGTVSMASEQAASNVNVIASAVEEMTGAIRDIAASTDEANRITRDAVTYARSSSEKVHTLGEAAREISKVTEVITEISEQTNLLALNATIEAARAGEAGKGFAVVANEIKELARQTAEATGEIRNKIESIQNSTDDTVTEINQISRVIDNVNEIVSSIAVAVDEQTRTASSITANVNEAAQGIAEVNENVAHSSTVSGEIARDIAEVSELAGNSRKCSLRVEESAHQLTRVVDAIQTETSRFRLAR